MNLLWLGYWVLAGVIAASPACCEEARVNVYNWSDYIAPDTIKKFEAATGIRVSYDVYDGNVSQAEALREAEKPFWRR